jgi:predicted kinase
MPAVIEGSPMLIVFGGLPGTGKTVIAKELAWQLDGVYLRIDSIEQAIRDSGVVEKDLFDAGYRVGYAVAEDNLRLGRTVIADSVNPLAVTRDAWLAAAHCADAPAIEIEVKCSDINEHRRRVEIRLTDIPGLRPPTWQEVLARDYQPWEREHLVIDTADQSIEESVKLIRESVPRCK